ncbi:MAG: hypothetical protein Q4G71_03015 [Pseudomonadota bacterium]|nr:hypothetical protein [Pseudomonadota bacterium]
MNRCSKHPIAASLIAVSALMAGGAAVFPTEAQAQRMFPQRVERGEITFLTQTQISLNGQAERLAPGARVRDQHNRIPLTSTLRGQTFVANYLRDPAGMVRDVWLLTEREVARPAPRAPMRGPQPMPAPVDPTLHRN